MYGNVQSLSEPETQEAMELLIRACSETSGGGENFCRRAATKASAGSKFTCATMLNLPVLKSASFGTAWKNAGLRGRPPSIDDWQDARGAA